MIKFYRKAVNYFKGQGNTEMASIDTSKPVGMKERYIAAMVLAGTGDALGYKGGEWEFCHQGHIIHEELKKMGGLDQIKVDKKHWCVSDDTVMHRATADALVAHSRDESKPELYKLMARYYKDCMNDMSGRAPGATCMTMTHRLNPNLENGYQIPFNPRGGGCGAAMRAMCIGLRYPRPEDIDHLIEVSIESGRMTHHHPTGYLGSLAAALFTAYSIQGKEPVKWAEGLMEVLDKAREYVKKGPYSNENLGEWNYFESSWDGYIEKRKLRSGKVEFPDNYDDPDVRDMFYKSISYGGWGGASGHDSTIIAYDAILGSNGDWEELCKRGVFHGGDSDSTGTIAACCYGAMYGFRGVPENNYKNLEYRKELEDIGIELYQLADLPERKTEAAGKTDEAAGKTDEAAGKTDEAAGKKDDAAGKTDEAAGKTDEAAGKTDEAAGKTDEAAGKTDEAAGKTDEASGTVASEKLRDEDLEMDESQIASTTTLERQEVDMDTDGEKAEDQKQSNENAADLVPCCKSQDSDQQDGNKPDPERGDPPCTKDITEDNHAKLETSDETTKSVSGQDTGSDRTGSEEDIGGKQDKVPAERERETVGGQGTLV